MFKFNVLEIFKNIGMTIVLIVGFFSLGMTFIGMISGFYSTMQIDGKIDKLRDSSYVSKIAIETFDDCYKKNEELIECQLTTLNKIAEIEGESAKEEAHDTLKKLFLLRADMKESMGIWGV